LTFRDLPHVNASLNGLATVLLLAGFILIKRGKIKAHATCMVASFITSIVFLVCYLTYHSARQMAEGVGHTKFTGTGVVAKVYYALLISHVILAAIVPVLAIITLRRAMKRDFVRHKAIARWTWPIWMYVSVTGVIVYFMLYHWYAPA